MLFRSQTTYDRYADTISSEIRMRTSISYIKVTDFNRHNYPKVSVPMYQAEVSRKEFTQLLLDFGVTSQDDSFETHSMYLDAYDELPRELCEIPTAMISFYCKEEK